MSGGHSLNSQWRLSGSMSLQLPQVFRESRLLKSAGACGKRRTVPGQERPQRGRWSAARMDRMLGSHVTENQPNGEVGQRARSLRTTQTVSASWRWSVLRARRLCGLQFRRQHPIEPWLVDFACPQQMRLSSVTAAIMTTSRKTMGNGKSISDPWAGKSFVFVTRMWKWMLKRSHVPSRGNCIWRTRSDLAKPRDQERGASTQNRRGECPTTTSPSPRRSCGL
jgi:hypothetical protein